MASSSKALMTQAHARAIVCSIWVARAYYPQRLHHAEVESGYWISDGSGTWLPGLLRARVLGQRGHCWTGGRFLQTPGQKHRRRLTVNFIAASLWCGVWENLYGYKYCN